MTARARAGAPRPQPHVAIISGLSGAGKTAASKLLEDLGYRVVDNLPAELLRQPCRARRARDRTVTSASRSCSMRAAATRRWPIARPCSALESRDITPQVFFLEARDDVLIRRFSETRHRHPLDSDEGGVAASIARERELLAEIRAEADVIIDTSELSGRQLRERLYGALDRARRRPDARRPAHQLRLQARHPARGGHGLRRALHGEPVLHRPPAAADRAR